MMAGKRGNIPIGGEPGAVGGFDPRHAISVEMQLARRRIQPELNAHGIKLRLERGEEK